MNCSTGSNLGANSGCRYGRSRSSGFSLVELVFTSSIGLMLILVLFESLLFCRRTAADMRCRLAADTLAFDVAWDVFNRQTQWFDTNASDPADFPIRWGWVSATWWWSRCSRNCWDRRRLGRARASPWATCSTRNAKRP